MNSNPIVSVIVPVYNVEMYIGRCIESVQKQEMPYWELILVDDGCTDASGDICEKYAASDNRIRVFHKENGGVSSARNIGLDNAQGEWVAFVDSDDLVDTDYLSIERISNNFQVVFKSFEVKSESDKIIKKKTIDKDSQLSGATFLKYFVRNRRNALWDKIIRRNSIGDVRFYEDVKVGEDFLFFLSCIPNIHNCYFSTRGCYTYYVREGSAMSELSSKTSEKIRILLDNMIHIKEIGEDKDPVLYSSIILSSYLPKLQKFFPLLTEEEKVLLKDVMKGIKLSSLKLSTIKQKIMGGFAYIYLLNKLR